MDLRKLWMTCFLFAGLSAVILSFGGCGGGSTTPSESGAVITSVYSQGLNSNCVGCFSGNSQVTVTVQDSAGTAAFQLNPNNGSCDSTFQQIGAWLYEVQATCETSACNGYGFLLVARQAYYGSTNNGFNNGIGSLSSSGCTVAYSGGNLNNNYNTTGTVSYSKGFLYRRNVNNNLTLVNRANGAWTSITQAMPTLEAF